MNSRVWACLSILIFIFVGKAAASETDDCATSLIEVSYGGSKRWFDDSNLNHPRRSTPGIEIIWEKLLRVLPENIIWQDLADWVDPAVAPIDLRNTAWSIPRLITTFGLSQDDPDALPRLRQIFHVLMEVFRSPKSVDSLKAWSKDALQDYFEQRRREIERNNLDTKLYVYLLENLDRISELQDVLQGRSWSKLQILDLFTRHRLLLFSNDPGRAAYWASLEGPPHFRGFNRLKLGESQWTIPLFFRRSIGSIIRGLGYWRRPLSLIVDQTQHFAYLTRSIFWNGNLHFPAINLDTVVDIITLQNYSEFRSAPSLLGDSLILDRPSTKILLTMDIPRRHQEEMLERFRLEIASREISSRPVRIQETDGDSVALNYANLERSHLIRIEERARELQESTGVSISQALRMLFHSEDIFQAYKESLKYTLLHFWTQLEEKRAEIRQIIHTRLDESFDKLMKADLNLSRQRLNLAVEQSFAKDGIRLSELDPKMNYRRWRREIIRDLLHQRSQAARNFVETYLQADIVAAIFDFALDPDHRKAFFHPSVHRIATELLLKAERRFSQSSQNKDQEKRKIILEFAGRFSSDPENIKVARKPEDLTDDLILQLERIGPLKPVASLIRQHGKWGIILLVVTPVLTGALKKVSDVIDHWIYQNNTTPPVVQADENLRILDLIHPVYTKTENEFIEKLGRFNQVVRYRGLNIDDISQIKNFFSHYQSMDWAPEVREKLNSVQTSFSHQNINVLLGSSLSLEEIEDLNFLILCMREKQLTDWERERLRLSSELRQMPAQPEPSPENP